MATGYVLKHGEERLRGPFPFATLAWLAALTVDVPDHAALTVEAVEDAADAAARAPGAQRLTEAR